MDVTASSGSRGPTPGPYEPGHPPLPAYYSCGDSQTYAYSPFASSFSLTGGTTGALPDLPTGSAPGDVGSLTCYNLNCRSTPTYQPHPLFFGDFNGDGLTDAIELDPATNTLSLRWNTGNGFGPAQQLAPAPWTAGSYKVVVADINNDGRADLIVFHDTPNRAITLMLSNGDGTFTTQDIPNADPGVNTPEGWTTSALGDFNGIGRLGIIRLVGASPTSDVIEQGTLRTLVQPTNIALSGSALLTQPAADLLVSVTDEGAAVARETVSYASGDAQPDSPPWSDKPESLSCPTTSNQLVRYPLRCVRKGLIVVRSVTSFDTSNAGVAQHSVYYSYEEPITDLRGRGFLGFSKVRVWDPARLQQTITLYDFAEAGPPVPPPAVFAPTPTFAPTLFQPGYYPGTERPQSVTTVTAIPEDQTVTPPALPRGGTGVTKANVRVVQTVYNNQLVHTNNDKTFVIQPVTGSGPAVVTSEWEQMAEMSANVTDPADSTSDYISGVATAPPSTAAVHTTTIPAGGLDAYGNILTLTEQATIQPGSGVAQDGAKVQIDLTYNNLTTEPNWLIGQLASRTITETDADPSATPVTRKVGFTYDGSGLLQTETQYQVTGGVTSTVSTTTLTRDKFGNVTSVAAQAFGPDGQMDTRQVNIEYDALWPGQPDERIFPSQKWIPVNLSTGAGSWTPSNWTLVHPAYGVVSATIDSNGVQWSAGYNDQREVDEDNAARRCCDRDQLCGAPRRGSQRNQRHCQNDF